MKSMFGLYFCFINKYIYLLDAVGCDVNFTVTETKVYIATEGYPNKYKQNQDCEFNFVAPTGRKIIVQFEDFNLEEEYDYLYFRKLQIMNTHIDIHTDTHKQIHTDILTHTQTNTQN